MKPSITIFILALAASTSANAISAETYDKEATEVALRRAARQVKANCGNAKDEDGKAKGPWGKGQVRLILARNGRSQSVAIGAPFDGKPTGRCAIQAFSNLTFPPWSGADVPITWDVEIDRPK